MDRAPFQVLVFPYMVLEGNKIIYAVFKRSDSDGRFWQAIAGGGNVGETILDAARRETFEEAAIDTGSEYIKLDSCATIPVEYICGFIWGEDVLVVPEYCFGVKVDNQDLQLSSEHTEYRWLSYAEAHEILSWDSNKNGLWELDLRLKRMLAESRSG